MLSEIAYALASTNDKYYFYLDLQTGAVVRILHRALDDNSFEAALDHLRDAFSRYV